MIVLIIFQIITIITKVNAVCSKVRYFSKSNLIRLKGNNKAKSLFKKVAQVFYCQLLQEICIKK